MPKTLCAAYRCLEASGRPSELMDLLSLGIVPGKTAKTPAATSTWADATAADDRRPRSPRPPETHTHTHKAVGTAAQPHLCAETEKRRGNRAALHDNCECLAQSRGSSASQECTNASRGCGQSVHNKRRHCEAAATLGTFA